MTINPSTRKVHTLIIGSGAAGLNAAASNLTESQYGLSSKKFRWNVSGTYYAGNSAGALPFSTDQVIDVDGGFHIQRLIGNDPLAPVLCQYMG